MHHRASLRSTVPPTQPESGCLPPPVRITLGPLWNILVAVLHLLLGAVHLTLLAITPILSIGLVVIGFAGLGIALLFGGLLHVPHFHVLPVLAISAGSFGLVILLHKIIDLLRTR